MPKPTTVASGAINKSDQLEIELHRPADLPAFILVKWPAAPSVASLDNFGNLVAAVYRIMADARTALSRRRGDRRTRYKPHTRESLGEAARGSPGFSDRDSRTGGASPGVLLDKCPWVRAMMQVLTLDEAEGGAGPALGGRDVRAVAATRRTPD
jgi:hypothetical protein